MTSWLIELIRVGPTILRTRNVYRKEAFCYLKCRCGFRIKEGGKILDPVFFHKPEIFKTDLTVNRFGQRLLGRLFPILSPWPSRNSGPYTKCFRSDFVREIRVHIYKKFVQHPINGVFQIHDLHDSWFVISTEGFTMPCCWHNQEQPLFLESLV